MTSFALGLKGSLQFDAVEVSLLYLYGVSNKIEFFEDGLSIGENDNIDVSIIEFKASYQFSETFGAFLAYRTFENNSVEISGFGAGIQYRF